MDLTATAIAIINDRFDLAKELLDLGADPNDGSLYFAVDMHDATTDMRAQDATRLQPEHPNQLTALTLVKALLDLGADPNKPFEGAEHSTAMCCPPTINSSPFYRAAVAADVEVLKLMLAHGAKLEWSPPEVKPKDGQKPGPFANANAGRTPLMVAMKGGQGAPIQGGPGYIRTGPPPFREPGSRDPLEAVKLLLAAGANPNAKAPDGSTPLHQAVQEQHVAMIRELAAAGGLLNAVNKDNLTPLGLAEKQKKAAPPPSNGAPPTHKDKKDSPAEVVAALRELMHLGPNDPAPQPPAATAKASTKLSAEKDAKNSSSATPGDQRAMKNLIVIPGALLCFGIAAAAAPTSAANTNADALRYRAMVTKYCATCHNQRAAIPADAPVKLDSAAFDDLLGHAATWERVLRKLSVRAMPPPGMPRPSEAEYAGFTSWLAASLDHAWEGHSNPGQYVLHRLNRAEYANAVRDLLAVDIDVSDLLPTDGAEFGFDNIATALKTSPMLLEAYVNAAQRVSAMAVGDPQVRPGTAEHSINREFSQNGYIDGLPLGTVGGTVRPSRFSSGRRVQPVRPADPRRAGRLLRRRGERHPRTRSSSPWMAPKCIRHPIGGPKDDEMQAADLARRGRLSTSG